MSDTPVPTMSLEGKDEAAQTLDALRELMARDPASMTIEERIDRAEKVADVLIEANTGLLEALMSTVEATDSQFQDVAATVGKHARVLGMIVAALEGAKAPAEPESRIITLDKVR